MGSILVQLALRVHEYELKVVRGHSLIYSHFLTDGAFALAANVTWKDFARTTVGPFFTLHLAQRQATVSYLASRRVALAAQQLSSLSCMVAFHLILAESASHFCIFLAR